MCCFSQAEQRDLASFSGLREVAEESALLHKVWDTWDVPRQAKKTRERKKRISWMSDSRVVSHLPPTTCGVSELALAHSFKRRLWKADCFVLRGEISCAFPEIWRWLTTQPRGSERSPPSSLNVLNEFQVAVFVFLLRLCKLRANVSPLVLASDASERGIGVRRTSAQTPQGLQTRQTRQQAEYRHKRWVGLIEIFAEGGGFRKACKGAGQRNIRRFWAWGRWQKCNRNGLARSDLR